METVIADQTAQKALPFDAHQLAEAIDDHSIHLQLVCIAMQEQLKFLVSPTRQPWHVAVDATRRHRSEGGTVAGDAGQPKPQQAAEPSGIQNARLGGLHPPAQPLADQAGTRHTK